MTLQLTFSSSVKATGTQASINSTRRIDAGALIWKILICYSTGSRGTHRCCRFANKVENIDRGTFEHVQVLLLPKVPRLCGIRSSWFLGPNESTTHTASRSAQPLCRAHVTNRRAYTRTHGQTTMHVYGLTIGRTVRYSLWCGLKERLVGIHEQFGQTYQK